MLPSALYHQHLQRPGFHADPLQALTVARLDALHQRLLTPRTWFTRNKTIRGLYLWGQVGIGKSFLVDLFFAALPDSLGKTRQHYQHFMAAVHRELHAITGQREPLRLVGKRLAAEFKVICLDELYLTDLGDAMIVYRLFESLFEEGVVLLITSNFAPERLYKDSLQPAIFAPAIKIIKANTEELHLASVQDYRSMQEGVHRTWFVAGEQDFAALFDTLNHALHGSSAFTSTALDIHGHRFHPLRQQGQLVWFTFNELCEKPRSAKDYIALAQRFKQFLVSGVPQFGQAEQHNPATIGTEDSLVAAVRPQYSNSENAQRRFISLVDELYDQGIKLHLQSGVPLENLYAGGRLAFEFQRTVSRLTEMQSATYRDRAWRS
ncbi:MAG: AFG1 family ATPase [Pseudomonadales bacterium]|nr:AFG1 family ATPase [Pseudomonadales bacterium]